MVFSEETVEVGGQLVIPDSFVNDTDPCIIKEKTKFGVHCEYRGGTTVQKAFYSYDWLNQMYAKEELNDPLPF